ncbi:MAG: HNH endonuclease [Schwartzia sp.]|nr:HNH endonuclease [Schwartzia sp. (in: firmicutes)]
MRWRWDQGRLAYFQYENIRSTAKVLQSLDGIDLGTKDDFLRHPLEKNTGLPFAPTHYKVWRNYSRVFQCAMLATSFERRLIVTELCNNLAGNNPFSPDEYLNFVFSRFQYPYPAFDGYNPNIGQVFPFVAILKFLISRGERPVSLENVFSYVIGNECTGLEEPSYYRGLQKTSRTPMGDEERQVREMLVFMGQTSYVRWFDGNLYLDTNDYDAVLSATVPFISPNREQEPNKEFLRLASLKNCMEMQNLDIRLRDRAVSEFAVKEGRKAFASHQKIERSPLLRSHFFKLHPVLVCDACGMRPAEKYPWLFDANILELHHILPLSATLNSNGTTTTLDDLRPLCPTCHRSIHIFYKNKLASWGIADFSSKMMAHDAYELAKREIV